MLDITTRSTRKLFIAIIGSLFAVTFILAALSGIGVFNALAWSVLGLLAVYYPAELIAEPIAINSTLLLIADALAAIAFFVLAAFLTATFYSFIRNVNLRRRGIMRKIRRLRNHVIITPFNGFAEAIMEDLRAKGIEGVIITPSEREARHLYARSMLAVVGEAGNAELLSAIGLQRAIGVVLCADDPKQNALAAVAVRPFNTRVKIIARVTSIADLPKLTKAGVHSVILPEVSAGTYLGNVILRKVSAT